MRFPLKIGPRTLALEHGIYARVLVEVGVFSVLPDKILVTRENEKFFIRVSFFVRCGAIGHDFGSCRWGE